MFVNITFILRRKMSYEYDANAHYAPYGKHQELITGEDLTQLEIVVKDDNRRARVFRLKCQIRSLI